MLLGACTQKERKKTQQKKKKALSIHGEAHVIALRLIDHLRRLDSQPRQLSSARSRKLFFFLCSCWIFLDVATEFAIFKEQDEMTSPFPPKGSCPSTKEEGTSRSFYCVAVRSFDSRQSTVKKKDPDFCEPYHKSKHITSRMKSSSFVDLYDFFSTTSFPLSCNKIWKRCNIQIKPFPDGLQPG